MLGALRVRALGLKQCSLVSQLLDPDAHKPALRVNPEPKQSQTLLRELGVVQHSLGHPHDLLAPWRTPQDNASPVKAVSWLRRTRHRKHREGEKVCFETL